MISRWRKLLLHTYNTYSAYRSTRNSIVCRGFSSNIVSISEPQAPVKEFSFFLEPEEVPPVEKSKNNVSVLEEQHVLEDLSDLGPPIDFQSFNFAAYVNHSNILKKLVDLGVDLYTVEKKTPKPAYLLTLDLDKDIAPRIQFLLDHGLKIDELGRFFTKNPYFFMNSLSDLQVRINYLESKKFSRDEIARIILCNPKWLNYSTEEVDEILGFFQREFKMKGYEVRKMVINFSSILNCPEKYVTKSLFEFRDVQEFSLQQCKRMLIDYPKVWTVRHEKLQERLDYVLVEMNIPRYLIVADPIALMTSRFKLKNRHTFLKALRRAQYDPKKPNYVSARALCLRSDAEFCQNVAKCSVETYNLYLKTL